MWTRSIVALLSAAACAVASAVASAAACTAQQAEAPARIPVLLVSGANNHDWEWTSDSLRQILEESGHFDVTVTRDPEATLAERGELAKYRAFVLDYNGPRWGEPAEQNFLDAVRNGTGVAVVHAANNAFPGWVEYEKLVGHLWRQGTGHGRFHAFDVAVTDRDHPITAGMPGMRRHPDELYHKLAHMHGVEFRVLATAHSSKESGGTGQDEPMIVVKRYGDGRVFHTPLGHVWKGVPQSRASHADPQFRWLIARGTEWAATGAVTLPPQPPNFLTAEEKAQGFRLLFDGRSTAGWRGFRMDGFPERGWRVEHGCLCYVGRGGGGDVVTEEQFADFDLRFQWKIERGGNSGVIYRVGEDEDRTWRTGPEYQLLDDGPNPRDDWHSAAALYGLVAPQGKSACPAGQFHDGRIVLRDGRVEHWLDGVKVVDCAMQGDAWRTLVADSKFKSMPRFGALARGHIALQDHGNSVWFRSIRIKELDGGGDDDR